MEASFGRVWHSWGDAAGLHLAVQFPGRCFDHEFIDQCKEYGIGIAAVDQHSICKGRHLDKLLFGYGHLEPEEIRRGVSLLGNFKKFKLVCPCRYQEVQECGKGEYSGYYIENCMKSNQISEVEARICKEALI